MQEQGCLTDFGADSLTDDDQPLVIVKRNRFFITEIKIVSVVFREGMNLVLRVLGKDSAQALKFQ